jgi:cell division inhibitor SepF
MIENLLNRAKKFIGLEEDEGSIEETREEINVETALRPRKGKNSSSSEYEIVIHEPKVYEDSMTISTQLRGGSPVIINLKHLVTNEEGVRLIDFVCGTAYAIDGHMVKIGEGIFLFTPNNIIISDVEDRSIEESVMAEDRPLFGRR